MVGSMRVNVSGAGPVVSGHELFADLSARVARPGRTYAAPFSLLAHAVRLTMLVALSISRVAPPAPTQDPLYIPIYGAPAALPPLPKGHAGSTRTERIHRPDPPAFTAPVESTTTEPVAVAPAEDLSPSTGSPLGADEGTVDGSEAGKAGGQAGGVPWGVPDGIVDGTGDLPVPVARPDQPPRLLQRIQPAYPQDAFVRKIQGVVKLQILIDARGHVARATVIESIPALDEAARAAVRQWVFAPALKDGGPVPTLAIAPVRFQIY